MAQRNTQAPLPPTSTEAHNISENIMDGTASNTVTGILPVVRARDQSETESATFVDSDRPSPRSDGGSALQPSATGDQMADHGRRVEAVSSNLARRSGEGRSNDDDDDDDATKKKRAVVEPSTRPGAVHARDDDKPPPPQKMAGLNPRGSTARKDVRASDGYVPKMKSAVKGGTPEIDVATVPQWEGAAATGSKNKQEAVENKSVIDGGLYDPTNRERCANTPPQPPGNQEAVAFDDQQGDESLTELTSYGRVSVVPPIEDRRPQIFEQDNSGVPGAGQDNEDAPNVQGYTLPTAAYVVDDIVQADVVDEDAAARELQKKFWYRQRRYVLFLSFCVLLGAVLITLGVTRFFDPKEPEVKTPSNETSNERRNETISCSVSNFFSSRPPLRYCNNTWCWVQLGHDLEGRNPIGEFGRYVSFAKNGSRILVSVGSEGSLGKEPGSALVYDILKNGTFVQVGQTIQGWAAEDEIRGALSNDGNRLALGAPYYPGIDGEEELIGQVRMYQLQNGNWTLLGKPLDGKKGKDRFGYSVHLNQDGSIVAVGATFQHKKMGTVRVYEYIESTNNTFQSMGNDSEFMDSTRDGTWAQLGGDINGEEDFDDKIGWTVELSDNGSVVAIGGKNDDMETPGPGRIRVFELKDGNWTQVGGDLLGDNDGDNYGRNVAISSDGSVVASGARLHHGADGTKIESGTIKVYGYNMIRETWTQIGQNIDGDNSHDRMQRVTLSGSGTRLAIFTGTEAINSTHSSTPGYVRVHDLIDGQWVQVGGRISGESYDGTFGAYASLSPDGNRIVVGAPGAPNGDPCYKGRVRVFSLQSALPAL